MMEKRQNPYQRLQEECRKWAKTVVYAHERLMWRFPAKTLHTDRWGLVNTAERVQAADQLGYECVLRWRGGEDGGLEVVYRKRPDSPPWSINP